MSQTTRPVFLLEREIRQSAVKGTAGKLFYAEKLGTSFTNKQYLAKTLELDWEDNLVNVSCIPEGEYPLVKRTWGKYYNAYKNKLNHEFSVWVKDVPARKHILIHTGNKLSHTRGCILVGGKIRVSRWDENTLLDAPEYIITNSYDKYKKVYKWADNFIGQGLSLIVRTTTQDVGLDESVFDEGERNDGGDL